MPSPLPSRISTSPKPLPTSRSSSPGAVARHHGQPGGLVADRDAERVPERAVAVAGVDPDLARVLHQHGQVEVAVAVEVAGHDRAGAVVDAQTVAGRGGQSDRRVGEAAVAVGGQDGEAVRALIDDHEIVAAVAGEVARDQADRLRERADGRAAGGRVQAVQAGAGAESQRLAEGVRGIVEQDGHVARGLVADDDVGQAVAVHVAHRDVRRRDAGGHGQGGARTAPAGVWKAMVTLLSSALAAIRSSSPLPVRSAAVRLVGSAVVEKAVRRETLPLALTV